MLLTFSEHLLPADLAVRWDACRTPLLSWFRAEARDLPWRAPYTRAAAESETLTMPRRPRRSPYAVWIAEIMLQQTVVAAVIPHFERWMRIFPDVRALADASPDQVLRAWAGLGYYARARNLHKGARMVVEGGVWPVEAAAWHEVPGVGAYTAGAVASLAFGRRAPILDGNIVRVFSRLQGLNFLPGAGAREKRLYWELASLWVGARREDADGAPDPTRGAAGAAVTADPGALNEALMELGALVCIPAAPRCDVCPLAASCAARAHGWTAMLPPAKPRAPIARVRAVAVLAHAADDVLMEMRPRGGFLAGHLMFPLFLGDEAAAWREAFRTRYPAWRFENRPDQSPGGPTPPVAALHHTIMSTRYDIDVYRAAIRPAMRAVRASRRPPQKGDAPVLAWIPGDQVGETLSNALARKIWKVGNAGNAGGSAHAVRGTV